MTYSLLRAFFRHEVVNMPQTGLLLEENRKHVWSDLSRLVNVECKNRW